MSDVNAGDLRFNVRAEVGNEIARRFPSLTRAANDASRSVGRSAANMERSFVSASRAINVAERALISFLAIAGTRRVVAFANEATEAFAELEAGIREIQSLSPELEFGAADFSDLQSGIENIRDEFGILTTDTVPALYQAISSGIERDNAIEFLGEAAQLSIAGVTDLATATDGLTTAVNAYGEAGVTAERASDVLFTTVQLARTTLTDLSRRLFQVAPIAAITGVSLEEVAAGLTAITRLGTPTRVAATQLRQVIVELGKDGTVAATAFERINGINFRDFISSGKGNLVDAIQSLEEDAAAAGDTIQNQFNSVIAGAGAAALTTADNFEESFDTIVDASGSVGVAAANLQNTFSFQLQELRAATERESQRLGGVIIQDVIELRRVFVNDLLPSISRIAETFIPLLVDNTGTAVVIMSSLANSLELVARVLDAIPAPLLQSSVLFFTLTRAVRPLTEIIGGLVRLFSGVRAAMVTASLATQVYNVQSRALVGTSTRLQLGLNSLAVSARAAGTSLATIGGGAVLLGAIALYSVFTIRNQRAAQAAREFAAAVEEAERSLISQNGALDLSNRSLANFIAQSTIFNEADNDVNNLADRLRQAGIETTTIAAATAELGSVTDATRQNFDDFADALDQGFLQVFQDEGTSFLDFLEGLDADDVTLSPGIITLRDTFRELPPLAQNLLATIDELNRRGLIDPGLADDLFDNLGETADGISIAAENNLAALGDLEGEAGVIFETLGARVQAGLLSPIEALSEFEDTTIRVFDGVGDTIGREVNVGEVLAGLDGAQRAIIEEFTGVSLPPPETDEFAEELQAMRDDAIEAAAAIDGVRDAIERLTGTPQSLADQRIALAQNLADIRESGSFDLFDEDGLLDTGGDLGLARDTLSNAVEQFASLAEIDPDAALANLQEVQQAVVDFVGPNGLRALVEQGLLAGTPGVPLEDLFLETFGLGGTDLTQIFSDLLLSDLAEVDVPIEQFLANNIDRIPQIIDNPEFSGAIAEAYRQAFENANDDFDDADIAPGGGGLAPFDPENAAADIGQYFSELSQVDLQTLFDSSGLSNVISIEDFFTLDTDARGGIVQDFINDLVGVAEDPTQAVDLANLVDTSLVESNLEDLMADLGAFGDVNEEAIARVSIRVAGQELLDRAIQDIERISTTDFNFPNTPVPNSGGSGNDFSLIGGSLPNTADGGIFSGEQARIIAEAGREAVIPLTRPSRALQLADESGLTAMLRSREQQKSIRYGDFNVNINGNTDTETVIAELRALQRRQFLRRYRR